MPICKLCLTDKELIKKSHIIPDFMYQDLYDDKHKLNLLSPSQMLKGTGYIRKPSSGIYEGGLLCADCDNKILGGLYEGYASKIMYSDAVDSGNVVTKHFKAKDGLEYSIISNIDYKKYKLFLLSILWRAHLSTNPFFKAVNLGPHAEIIRKMIYDSNPGREVDYPIFFSTFYSDFDANTKVIISPRVRKMASGHKVYVFVIGGFIYAFYVNSKRHNIPEKIKQSTINLNNELNIFHFPEGKSQDFILGFMGVE